MLLLLLLLLLLPLLVEDAVDTSVKIDSLDAQEKDELLVTDVDSELDVL